MNGAQDGRGLIDHHLLHGLTVGLLDLILMHDGVEDFVPGRLPLTVTVSVGPDNRAFKETDVRDARRQPAGYSHSGLRGGACSDPGQ